MMATETHSSELIVPELTNHYGTLYGVQALQIMGKAAFVCASRHAKRPIVMVKADSIEFRKPVRLGEIIDIHAQVVFQGRSSMTVLVDIATANVETPQISGRFMMVAVDDAGLPTPISDAPRSSKKESFS